MQASGADVSSAMQNVTRLQDGCKALRDISKKELPLGCNRHGLIAGQGLSDDGVHRATASRKLTVSLPCSELSTVPNYDSLVWFLPTHGSDCM